MGQRTIIEINHDYLPQAGEEIAHLISMLPHAGIQQLKDEFRYSSVIKVLAHRDSYHKLKLEVE